MQVFGGCFVVCVCVCFNCVCVLFMSVRAVCVLVFRNTDRSNAFNCFLYEIGLETRNTITNKIFNDNRMFSSGGKALHLCLKAYWNRQACTVTYQAAKIINTCTTLRCLIDSCVVVCVLHRTQHPPLMSLFPL